MTRFVGTIIQSVTDPDVFFVMSHGECLYELEDSTLRYRLGDREQVKFQEQLLSSLSAGGGSPVAAASEGIGDQARHRPAGSESCGCESSLLRQACSLESAATVQAKDQAGVAQSVEQVPCKHKVGCSSHPTGSTLTQEPEVV